MSIEELRLEVRKRCFSPKCHDHDVLAILSNPNLEMLLGEKDYYLLTYLQNRIPFLVKVATSVEHFPSPACTARYILCGHKLSVSLASCGIPPKGLLGPVWERKPERRLFATPEGLHAVQTVLDALQNVDKKVCLQRMGNRGMAVSIWVWNCFCVLVSLVTAFWRWRRLESDDPLSVSSLPQRETPPPFPLTKVVLQAYMHFVTDGIPAWWRAFCSLNDTSPESPSEFPLEFLFDCARISATAIVIRNENMTAELTEAARDICNSNGSRMVSAICALLTPELLKAESNEQISSASLRRITEFIFVRTGFPSAEPICMPSPRNAHMESGAVSEGFDISEVISDMLQERSFIVDVFCDCFLNRKIMTTLGCLVERNDFSDLESPNVVACEVLRYSIPLCKVAEMLLIDERCRISPLSGPFSTSQLEKRRVALCWARTVLLSGRSLIKTQCTTAELRRGWYCHTLFAKDLKESGPLATDSPLDEKSGCVRLPISRIVFESMAMVMGALASLLLSPDFKTNSVLINRAMPLLYEIRLSMLQESGTAGPILLTEDDWRRLLFTHFRVDGIIARWSAEGGAAGSAGHASAGFLPLLRRIRSEAARPVLDRSPRATASAGRTQFLLLSHSCLRSPKRRRRLYVDDLDRHGATAMPPDPVLGTTVAALAVATGRAVLGPKRDTTDAPIPRVATRVRYVDCAPPAALSAPAFGRPPALSPPGSAGNSSDSEPFGAENGVEDSYDRLGGSRDVWEHAAMPDAPRTRCNSNLFSTAPLISVEKCRRNRRRSESAAVARVSFPLTPNSSSGSIRGSFAESHRPTPIESPSIYSGPELDAKNSPLFNVDVHRTSQRNIFEALDRERYGILGRSPPIPRRRFWRSESDVSVDTAHRFPERK